MCSAIQLFDASGLIFQPEFHVATTSTTDVPFFASAFSKAFFIAAFVLRTLAKEWLSSELLSALRTENMLSDLTEKQKLIVEQVKALIVQRLCSGTEQEIVGYLRTGRVSSCRFAA